MITLINWRVETITQLSNYTIAPFFPVSQCLRGESAFPASSQTFAYFQLT